MTAAASGLTFEQLYVIAAVVLPLTLVILNRLRADLAALLIAFLLGLGQFLGFAILGPAQTPDAAVNAIVGLSRPVIWTLISLFILTGTLDKFGITRWIAVRLLKLGGVSERRLIVLFTVTAAALSLIMNNVAAGALLLPSAMDAARRSGIRPSKLLIPVSFGTLLGGGATYFTTANIIMSSLLTSATPPQEPLGIFDFAAVGGLIALAGIAYIAVFGPRLLPERGTLLSVTGNGRTELELEAAYGVRERLWEADVLSGSTLVGKTLAQGGIGQMLGVTVAAIRRRRQTLFTPRPSEIIQSGDELLIVGREDRVTQLAPQGLEIVATSERHVRFFGVALVEAILAPRSKAEGQTLKSLQFRTATGFTAIALRRNGANYRTDVANFTLQPGDSLLLIGRRERLKALRADENFLILEAGEPLVERHKVALAVAITALAIAASVTGMPSYLAMLGGALLIILTGLLSTEEAYSMMEWRTIFLIAGMYSVSTAMSNTGLAASVGRVVVDAAAPFGSLGLVAGVFVLTMGLTQVMGGQVTALVTGPIAISAALHFGVNPQAIAVVTAIACNSAYLTPVAHAVNVVMMAPGNYRFGDFARLGIGLTVVCFIMLLIGMRLFWGV